MQCLQNLLQQFHSTGKLRTLLLLIRRGASIDIDTVPDVGYECSTHAQHQPSMKSGSDIAFGKGASANEGGGAGNIAMLWIIALQQPLAKSVHPLHVRSWERHGADEDMQETLKYFAAFCGRSPQELAEEIRAMSPAVKKRFEEGTSKSWLKAWEDEADEREKEHPGGAVHDSLYFVRGFLVGTGSLESRFFKGRQPNLARRMSEESMNHRIRIYMNGPDVEEFCSRKLHGTETTYHAGALCQRSKVLYRNYFGSKTLQGRERRCKREAKDGEEAAIYNYKNKGKKTGMKIGHMAHHLQEKRKQAMKRKTGKASDMGKLLLQKLSETPAEPNELQVEQKKKALDNKGAKRRFIEGMLLPEAGAPMKQRHREEVTKQQGELMKHKASLISLTHNVMKKKWVAAEDCKVFWPGELKAGWWLSQDLSRQLSQDLTVVTSSVSRFRRKAPEKIKFWQVSTVGPFLNGNWQAHIVLKGLLMEDVGLLGAVLFGGYLVDQAWVEKSNPLLKKELLLEPLWKLRGSAVNNKKLEVFFADNVVPDGVISRTMSAVFEAKPDRVWQLEAREADDPSKIHQPAESSHWVWRTARDEIRTKDAWVVCGEEKDVKKLVEKRDAAVAKVEQLMEEIEKLQEKQTTAAGKKLKRASERLVEKRGSLKEQEAKLKMMKGRPVALKKFLEEVVLPGCVLCPL